MAARYYNPFDAEYGDDPSPNGTMLITRNGTLVALPTGWENSTPWLARDAMAGGEAAAMLDIYHVGVGGVIIVGAVFACGIVTATLLSAWWIVSYLSELTVDAIFWVRARCDSFWCCRDREYTVDGDDIEVEETESLEDEPSSLRVAE